MPDSTEKRLDIIEKSLAEQLSFNEQLVGLIVAQGETIAQLQVKEVEHQETASKLEVLIKALSDPLSLLSSVKDEQNPQ